MTEYKSKQVSINKPEEMIYSVLSDFNNFTPIVKDKVSEWEVIEDCCSFKVSGFTLKLRMVEKEPCKMIKLTGDNTPFEFHFWVQLKNVADGDTRMRLTVHAKLNAMMKMMVGSKLQDGIDKMADHIAEAFNKA